MDSGAVTIRPSYNELSNELGSCSASDIRRITKNWIVSQGTVEDQLVGITDIFEQAGAYGEGLNEVIMEAWGCLVDGKVWQARFQTREEAIKALDNPLLKEFRHRAAKSRGRKEK